MVATLVTCCCAWATEPTNNDSNSNPGISTKRVIELRILSDEIEKHKAFKKSKTFP